jgi:uracil-DNA glycosylase family 4
MLLGRSRHRFNLGNLGIRGLQDEIVRCRKCPRLVAYREWVQPRKAFLGQNYWRKPVHGFGDINARLLVLGISPAAQGGNRTGRVFTGDSSGRFLVKALHSVGFANQPVSESRGDGLTYTDCYLTAAVKCAPPGDRPTRVEFHNCSPYLDAEIALLRNLRAVLALGGLSFHAYLDHLRRKGESARGIKFMHGAVYRFKRGPSIYVSYHPSPRNTNTGKLTHGMLVEVIGTIRRDLPRLSSPSKDN